MVYLISFFSTYLSVLRGRGGSKTCEGKKEIKRELPMLLKIGVIFSLKDNLQVMCM